MEGASGTRHLLQPVTVASTCTHYIPGDLEPLTGLLNKCLRNRTFLAAKRGDSVLELGVFCFL